MQLTDREKKLITKLKALVATERKTLTAILEHLQVVYDTRLFAKLGYSSLIKYMIRELSYSESAAYRRMQALRLVKEVPASKEMIEQGSLTLSNISQLQTMLKNHDTTTKKRAIAELKGKTSAEAKDSLFKLAPENEKTPRDQKKKVSTQHTRLSITLSKTTMEKMERVQAATKKYNYNELIEYLLDQELNKTTKTRKSTGSTNPRTIPAQVKREIMQRAQGRCEHPGCGEMHFLELDHEIPIALGGTNAKDNLRIVCRAHNQLYAIQKLGMEKMNKYINR